MKTLMILLMLVAMEAKGQIDITTIGTVNSFIQGSLIVMENKELDVQAKYPAYVFNSTDYYKSWLSEAKEILEENRNLKGSFVPYKHLASEILLVQYERQKKAKEEKETKGNK